MAQQEIEIILARQLASYLAVPIFLVGPNETLLYYNRSAEEILGERFDETGRIPFEEWSGLFTPTDESGEPIDPKDLPLAIALRERRMAHRTMWIRALDGPRRRVDVTSIPLTGQGHRSLGAIAIFWERDES